MQSWCCGCLVKSGLQTGVGWAVWPPPRVTVALGGGGQGFILQGLPPPFLPFPPGELGWCFSCARIFPALWWALGRGLYCYSEAEGICGQERNGGIFSPLWFLGLRPIWASAAGKEGPRSTSVWPLWSLGGLGQADGSGGLGAARVPVWWGQRRPPRRPLGELEVQDRRVQAGGRKPERGGRLRCPAFMIFIRVFRCLFSECVWFVFSFFFGCLSAHGVPRPGIRSELWLRPKLQLRSRQILNPLCRAGDRTTCIPVLPGRRQSCCATVGTP